MRTPSCEGLEKPTVKLIYLKKNNTTYTYKKTYYVLKSYFIPKKHLLKRLLLLYALKRKSIGDTHNSGIFTLEVIK